MHNLAIYIVSYHFVASEISVNYLICSGICIFEVSNSVGYRMPINKGPNVRGKGRGIDRVGGRGQSLHIIGSRTREVNL